MKQPPPAQLCEVSCCSTHSSDKAEQQMTLYFVKLLYSMSLYNFDLCLGNRYSSLYIAWNSPRDGEYTVKVALEIISDDSSVLYNLLILVERIKEV